MSDTQNQLIGQLFTHVYRDRGGAANDSPKFRRQLQAHFSDGMNDNDHYELSTYIARHSGISVTNRAGYVRFNDYLLACPIDELLDCITLIYRFVVTKLGQRPAAGWLERVQYSFDTHNLAYRVDEKGGVHHKIDTAFDNSRALILTCLSGSKFVAAHDEIQKAFDFLTQQPQDTKMAVVNTFLAAENIFKIVVGANNGLTGPEVKRLLMPIVQKQYSQLDNATKQATGSMVNSFASWSDACHPYRHGQRDVEIVAPPIGVAIALVTMGGDFIRWLVELSQAGG